MVDQVLGLRAGYYVSTIGGEYVALVRGDLRLTPGREELLDVERDGIGALFIREDATARGVVLVECAVWISR